MMRRLNSTLAVVTFRSISWRRVIRLYESVNCPYTAACYPFPFAKTVNSMLFSRSNKKKNREDGTWPLVAGVAVHRLCP